MRKILVAEDNPVGRELVREILEAEGYDVIEACDGREALEKILSTEPDLVLLDIQMPELDGFEVLRELRQHPRLLRRPIVALTAYAMDGDAERALAAGFDAYATKPIDVAKLSSQIRQWLDHTVENPAMQ